MMDPSDVPPVGVDELLARFVLSNRHVRSQDSTVKPDAFLPPRNLQLSVSRHLMATDAEIWELGRQVAQGQSPPKTLYGRADVVARHCHALKLAVKPEPIAGNPNHAEVIGWPSDKSAQKMKAIELAKEARYSAAPRS